MRRFFGTIGLALMLTAAVLFAVSQFLPHLDDRMWAGAYKTTGQVAGFLQNGAARVPLVSFVAEDGIPYLFEANGAGGNLQQGQVVTVRYFLSPDLKASLIRDFHTAQLIYAISGCALAAMGLALLILQLRKTSLRRQLVKYGTRVPAVVTGTEPCLPISLFGRRVHNVTLTARSPQGIGEISLNGRRLLQQGSRLFTGSVIPVLMDISTPRQYVILWEEAGAAASVPVTDT